MKKSTITVIASGALIVIGMILLVIGSQVILEGVIQGNGIVNSNQELVISGEFDSQKTVEGVFAVQIMQFKENSLFVKVIDPLENQIASQEIIEENTEKEFDILETGMYQLIIQSESNEDTQVFGAIGPLPDAGKKSLSFISLYVLIVGMIGLVGSGIYKIKSGKKSV